MGMVEDVEDDGIGRRWDVIVIEIEIAPRPLGKEEEVVLVAGEPDTMISNLGGDLIRETSHLLGDDMGVMMITEDGIRDLGVQLVGIPGLLVVHLNPLTLLCLLKMILIGMVLSDDLPNYRGYIRHVEDMFEDRRVRTDTVFVSPRASIPELTRQLVLDGVLAVVFLSHALQDRRKVSMQTFQRNPADPGAIKWDGNCLVPNATANFVQNIMKSIFP
jgi:hypothetical protein